MRQIARKILGWLSNIAGFLLIALIFFFWAIHRLFVVTKARLFASPVPSTPLVECVWISNSGVMQHDSVRDYFSIEECDFGKIVRSVDAAIITSGYAKMSDSEPVRSRRHTRLRSRRWTT